MVQQTAKAGIPVGMTEKATLRLVAHRGRRLWYLHQRLALSDGRYAADAMWGNIDAPCAGSQQLVQAHGRKCQNDDSDILGFTEPANPITKTTLAAVNGKLDLGRTWIMHFSNRALLMDLWTCSALTCSVSQSMPRPRLDFVLEPGDVVVWSAGWWHATLALEDSLAIAQNLLNEHNYEEFRKTSQSACLPGGSHGIRSPGVLAFADATGHGTECTISGGTLPRL